MQKPFSDPLFRLLVAAGGILLIFAALLLHIGQVWAVILRLLHIFRPLLLGILFATMLEPSYERLRTDFSGFAGKHRIRTGWIQPVSLLGAILPPVSVIVSVICILVPQMARSIGMISENISIYTDNLKEWFGRYTALPIVRLLSAEKLESQLSALQAQLPKLLLKTYDYTSSLIDTLLDIGIGTVFALYLLADKPRLSRQLKRLCGSRSAGVQTLLRRIRFVCNTFARFLGSQCKEALILGGLCFLGMRLLHFPYPVLISAVIGMTNMIPYLGPLAGTIPCALLILLVQPRAVPWFLLFIIILQQLESNLIYPRVVGQSIGLPSAWVLAAIVIGGGLCGISGMLLGVPLAAVLYAVLFPEVGSAFAAHGLQSKPLRSGRNTPSLSAREDRDFPHF